MCLHLVLFPSHLGKWQWNLYRHQDVHLVCKKEKSFHWMKPLCLDGGSLITSSQQRRRCCTLMDKKTNPQHPFFLSSQVSDTRTVTSTSPSSVLNFWVQHGGVKISGGMHDNVRIQSARTRGPYLLREALDTATLENILTQEIAWERSSLRNLSISASVNQTSLMSCRNG
jgi:hypothetical protein